MSNDLIEESKLQEQPAVTAADDQTANTDTEVVASEEAAGATMETMSAMDSGGEGGGNPASVGIPSVDMSPFSGTPTISYPLEVPPGRLNMAPNLALHFIGALGNGWIGKGWDLGLGTIQRSTRYGCNYSANNYAASMNGSTADLVARADWGANYYGARIEGMLSKYFFNTSTGGWEVTSKDGTKYYYGTTAASRQDFASGTNVFKWCLDRVQDTNGNYMTVTYVKDQGDIYLNRIDYTGNGGMSPTNYVQFYLEDRTDAPCMFQTCYQVKTAKRLKTIEMRAGGSMVRVYRLTYVTSASTWQSLASTIQMYGNDAVLDASGTVTAGTALPPVSLSSGELQAHSFTDGPLVTYTDVYDWNQWWLGDFNGDGKKDILYVVDGGGIRVKFSDGDGTFTDGPLVPISDVNDWRYWWLGDFNGNGKTDILYAVSGGGIRVKFSNGDGSFTDGPLVPISDVYDWNQWWLGDFNGDGKTDILYHSGPGVIRVKFSNGDGTFTDGPQVIYTDVYDWNQWWLGDFNGDGKTDILYHSGPGVIRVKFSNGDGTFTDGPQVIYTDVYDWNQWWLGDFNGDGKTDILYHSGPGVIRVKFSNGDGTFTDGPQVIYTDVYDWNQWWLGDFNGDGKTDILYHSGPGVIRVKFSNGDGTFTDGPQVIYTDVYDWNQWWLGDFNGDGKTDILYHATGGWLRVKFSSAGLDMPLSITDPLGATTDISYKPSSAYQNTLLPFIIQTVSSIVRHDGRGAAYTTSYDYASGLYDYTEREFRGFGYVKTSQMRDASTYESRTETWFHQDFTRKGLPSAQLITSREGHTRRVDNTWTVAALTTGVTYPRLDSTQSTMTDAGYTPYTFASAYTYDPTYLNVLDEHKTGMTPADETHTCYAYTTLTGPWIVSKPMDVRITDASGYIKSRKWMDYDGATGNLLAEEVCKSDHPETDGLSRNATQNCVTTYQYYAEGNISDVTDPRGNTTSFAYDATKIFRTSSTNALGHVTSKTFDPGTGNTLTMVPPHLQGTSDNVSYQYDVFGRLTQETRPDGGYTTIQYVNIGNPQTQYADKMEHITGGASALDHHTCTYFDGLGRAYSAMVTGPDGKTIASDTTYDLVGRVASRSKPYFYTIDTPVYTQITYDGLSRVTVTAFPDSGQVTTSYQGLAQQVQDQRGHSTLCIYDVYKKLALTQDAYGTSTQYTYDTLGNLVCVVAAVGQAEENATTMTYDSLSEKRTMTDPDMGYWTYTYDRAGNLISQTDASGQTIGFTYDALNRITQKTYPDYTVTYTYDDAAVANAKGKLTCTLDPSGGENKEDRILAFDLMQRVLQSRKSTGTTAVTINESYDTAGRCITMAYFPGTQDEKSYTYAYNAAGNLLSLRDNTAGTNHVEYSNFTALGQHQTAVFPKPSDIVIQSAYTYDSNMGRLSTLVTQKIDSGTPAATYQNLTYQYDLKGNVIAIADTLNSISHAYTYDNLDRLVSAAGTGTGAYSQTYSYDRIGNIVTKSDVGTYTYGSKPHAVLQAGNVAMQYDANGNMTRRADSGTGIILDIAWNANNMPSVINRSIGGGPSQPYVTFTYDGSGARVRKVNNATGATTLYFGDLYEMRGTVGVIQLFAGNQRVCSIRSDGSVQYYHGNHLGSAAVVTDQNGNMKEKIEYFPFGAYRARTDYDALFPSVNYTFTDQEDDDETGLYHYKARLYDPVLGRFISADFFIQNPYDLQTLNRYSYVRNNPLRYLDPSGNFSLGDVFDFLIGVPLGIPPTRKLEEYVFSKIPNDNVKNTLLGMSSGFWNSFSPSQAIEQGGYLGGLAWLSSGIVSYSDIGGWGIHVHGSYAYLMGGLDWQSSGPNSGLSGMIGLGYSYGYFTAGIYVSANISQLKFGGVSASVGVQEDGWSVGINYNFTTGQMSGRTSISLGKIADLEVPTSSQQDDGRWTGIWHGATPYVTGIENGSGVMGSILGENSWLMRTLDNLCTHPAAAVHDHWVLERYLGFSDVEFYLSMVPSAIIGRVLGGPRH